MKNKLKYARKCDVSGKGMNEGWVWGDGVFYTSTKEITLAECRKDKEHILYGLKNLGCELDELDNVQTKEDLEELQSAIENTDSNKETDSDLLNIGYYTDYLYYTEWEEIEDDWFYLEDGTEIQTINNQ